MMAVLAASVGTAAPAKKSDPEIVLPGPQVTLRVTPGAGGGLWRLQIENTGEGPVRIPADPRLLILELTPPASADPPKKKGAPKTPPRCILPDDIRPSADYGHELVVPAKRSWSATFDPLFYCFGARERAALVPGTSVKASFGWPVSAKKGKTPKPAPPFAVVPVGASVGKVRPAKALEADAFSLSEAVVKPPEPPQADAMPWLSVPEAMDAARGVELGTTVTLTNGNDRPITLLFRPDMIEFSVSGPQGTVQCGSPRTISSPIRELFSTVPVKGKTSTSVLMTTTCPPGTFDEPGIYRILPKLDTTNASGRPLAIKSWDGVAVGKAPLLLRVRAPRQPAALARATLD